MPEHGSAERFKPSPRLKTLYGIYYASFALPYVLCVCLPIVLLAFHAGLGLHELGVVILLALGPVLISAPIVAYWINAYYDSAWFTLTENEIIVERGVWWKRKDVVPYNRITNLSIVQGPISRWLGLATIRVQTAGFSTAGSAGAPAAEAVLFGVENAEELAEKVMGIVRSLRPVAVEAAPELARPLGDVMAEMLAELRRIRELMERQRG